MKVQKDKQWQEPLKSLPWGQTYYLFLILSSRYIMYGKASIYKNYSLLYTTDGILRIPCFCTLKNLNKYVRKITSYQYIQNFHILFYSCIYSTVHGMCLLFYQLLAFILQSSSLYISAFVTSVADTPCIFINF